MAPRETVRFVFWKLSNVSWVEGNIGVEGKQKSLFPLGPAIKCFGISWLKSKMEKSVKKFFAWLQLAHKFAVASGACPDHIQVRSSSCCFCRELVSFVCPKELVSFDPQYMTCSVPIGKYIWVGRDNKGIYSAFQRRCKVKQRRMPK